MHIEYFDFNLNEKANYLTYCILHYDRIIHIKANRSLSE